MDWKQYSVLGIIVAVMAAGMYTLTKEKWVLQEEKDELTATLAALQKENESAKDLIEYFKYPENLLKELKSQFNYREAGEKLIILVPASTSTPSSTSTRN